MTISTAQSATILLGNGVTSSWVCDFIPDASEYIYVTYTNASGTETVLSSSQYSITINPVAAGQIWATGFTIVYPLSGSPIANGTSLTVQRILPLQQLTSLENQGNFYPQAVEAGLDVLEMQIQQVSARTGSYRGVWATGVLYNFGDIVQDGVNGAYTNNLYVCAIANTSGTWATDLAAGDWSLALNVQTLASGAAYLPLSGGTITGNLAVMGGVSAPYLGLGVAESVTGSANAIILTVSATPATLQAGQIFQFKPIHANTGATTLTVEPLGATKNVYKQSTTGPTALQGGEFQIGQMALVAYDGTEFQLISTSSTAVSGGGYIASTNVQVFTSNGTYTPSAGMTQAIIECWGGGGGGGAAQSATGATGGGGGGAGGYSRKTVTAATVGSSQTVTIGAAGSSGFSSGGNGGTSSVGSLCIANGGIGAAYASSNSVSSGGNGGQIFGAIGDITSPGQNGGSGVIGTSGNAVEGVSGFGGSSSVGAGGSAVLSSGSGATGNSGSGYGAGGSGGSTQNYSGGANGGAGSSGYVYITEIINTATGSGSTTALTASSINGGQLAGLRNRTINGDMRIDQRNAGAAQTITAGTSGTSNAYTIDRFYAASTGANVTGQRVAGTAPDQYAYQFTGASSVTGIAFGQRYEATNIYDLASTTATFSVRLANSLLTTVTWTAYYPTSTDTWSGRTSIATGTFTVYSTPTTYSTQISLPSNVTTGLEIELTVGAQVSGTWTVAEWQLENGSVTTPFERRPIGLEVSLAKRYYTKTFALNTAPANNLGFGGALSSGATANTINPATTWIFSSEMFSTPTVILYNPSSGSSGSWSDTSGSHVIGSSSTNIASSGVNISGSVPGSGITTSIYFVHATASAEL